MNSNFSLAAALANLRRHNPRDFAQLFLDVAVQGKTDAIRTLIDAGADLNTADKNGCTALIWAAYNGHTEIARLLIEKGADLNTADKDGNTALIWAGRNGHAETAWLLIEKGANPQGANVDATIVRRPEGGSVPLATIRAALKLS